MATSDHHSPAGYHGTDQVWRDFISEAAIDVSCQAESIVAFCELGDDKGLAYAIMCLHSNVRAIVATAVDLRANRETLRLRK